MKYIGITIGPIYDTISLTSKPAGMWAASYLFSYISRKICEGLMKEMNINYDQFICPYFEIDERTKQIKKPVLGVGIFPDRIIFYSEDPVERYKSFFDSIKREIGKKLANNEISKIKFCEYMKNYIQIYAVELDIENGKNPIYEISPYLDSYELQRCFIQNETNDSIINFYLKSKYSNRNVRQSFLVQDCYNEKNLLIWDLDKKDGKIKNLEDIAKVDFTEENKNLKRNYYYAIVQADGDNMGKLLKMLRNIEQIRKFSSCLLDYSIFATKKIREYGGIPIYVGGDDLLFIAPLLSRITGENHRDQESILELIDSISEEFKRIFKYFIEQNLSRKEEEKLEVQPSLSWGIEISYYRFPLYEAFERVGGLLFNVAKNIANKNTIVIEYLKHSGKESRIIIQKSYDIEKQNKQRIFNKSEELLGYQIYCKIRELIKLSISVSDNKLEEKEKIILLQSVPYKISMFQHVLKIAKSENEIIHVLDNAFDDNFHKDSLVDNYLTKIKELYILVWKQYMDMGEQNKIMDAIGAVIKFLNLYIERREN